MNLTQIAKIARREYLARVRSRAFVFMTILVPMFLGLYMVAIPAMGRSSRSDVRVAILDAGTGLGQPLAERIEAIEQPHVTVTEVTTSDGPSDADRERLTAAVRERSLDGYLLIEREAEAAGGIRGRYLAWEVGDQALRRQLLESLRSAAIGDLLVGSGVDVERVRQAQRLALDSITVSAEGERSDGFARALGSTMVLAMLMYMAVLINGQGMATAIVEEKSSRLIEVILGAVTATEFMTGKILGVLGSGLTQLAVWVAVGALVVVQGLPALSATTASAGFDLSAVLNGRLLFYFAIFFALGFLLYSVLFALVAVTCTSTEELGQSMFAAILPMVVGLMAALSVLSNPTTTLTRVLSLIPFFTPLVMLARVNILMPPLWEVWTGIALLFATSLAIAWAAAKVFRYALLMTGQRPTLPELMRVVRAG